MHKSHSQSPLNIISRRSFLNTSFKAGMLAAMASVMNIPPFLQRALAEGTIGVPGGDGKINKLLFIWLRGANDALNSIVPIRDTAYGPGIRPTLRIDPDPGASYAASGPCFDPTQFADIGETTLRAANQDTYSYTYGIPLRNGFAALHPALKFLAPVYNAGDLGLIHRVGYPKQSRSHFDSQRYWENGTPNLNIANDGIFYRTIYEGILASPTVANRALTGVTIQSSLPLILRGSERAMTNLSNVGRYKLLGVPGVVGLDKAETHIAVANTYPFPDKQSREMLELNYNNLLATLPEFEVISSLLPTNFTDNVNTDNDLPYTLFPITNATNGGYAAHGNDPDKYVVDTGAYNTAGTGFFNNLKAAALVLNKTDAIIAGTEMGGFDTHAGQGRLTGAHPNLNKRIGWALYALRKYFLQHADRCTWDNLIVVTLSEFGRTTIENADQGTDHAEAGVMWVAGGSIKGHGSGSPNGTGVFGCSDSEFTGGNAALNWLSGPANQGGNVDGSMFGVSDRYLKRIIDYRSALGEIIRKHLGATPAQLNNIIAGYATEPELASQRTKATSVKDGTSILGEVGFL